MDLEKVTAKIRPRRGWEAIDLGISLVQQHAKVLYKIWFLTSVPIFILLALVLYQSPLWVFILLWLLKPILERPLLHYLSRVLFGEALTIKQCLKAFFSVAKIQLFASLTWRRLSFTRSLDLPLIQLEGLKSLKRANRLKTLHSGDSGSAVWLTIVFFLVELIFFISVISLIYLLIPEIYLEDFNLFSAFFDLNGNLFEYRIYIFLYFLGMSFIAPFYVACGFALYLNQRTHLEAWDIELSFKRLAARLNEKSENSTVRLASYLFSFILVSGLVIHPVISYAEEESIEIKKVKLVTTDQNTTVEQVIYELEKQQEQNSGQSLTHQQIKQMIIDIKQGDDFHQIEKKEINRYRSSDSNNWFDSADESSSISSGWLIFAKLFALLVEFALWIFVAVLVIFLVIKYKHLLGNTSFNKKIKTTRPKRLFGLDLDTESLPENPWQVAHKLVEKENYRQALSLLYRASLIWYIDNKNVLIKEGYTEIECLQQIVKNVGSVSQGYIKKLTNTWRGLAYAHIQPEKARMLDLCDSWPKVMQVSSSRPIDPSNVNDDANKEEGKDEQ